MDQLPPLLFRCNAVGVNVIVDFVINQMTGGFAGIGTGGSLFDGASQVKKKAELYFLCLKKAHVN